MAMVISKVKVCLAPAFGLMVVTLVLYAIAVATNHWLEMPCGDDQDVNMGLWKMCLEPDGECVSFTDEWEDMPSWVEAIVGLHLTGIIACFLTTLLMLICLILPPEVAQDNLAGLGFAALGTASFIVVGQMVVMGERSSVHALFASFEEFSGVDCVGADGEIPRAGSSWSLHLVWAAFTFAICVGIPLVAAGAQTHTTIRKTTTTSKGHHHMREGHDNPEFNTDDENHNKTKKRPTATKMIDAYRERPAKQSTSTTADSQL